MPPKGYIYAPYILKETVTIVSPTFNPRKSLTSRYATKMVMNSMYGSFAGGNFKPVIEETFGDKLNKTIERIK